MLVKLGDSWINPFKVIGISPDEDKTAVWVEGNREYLVFNDVDEAAAIINNAIGQSYGGSDEEAETSS